MKHKRMSNKNKNRVFINKDIRAKEVRCIDHNNENLGVIKTYKAIELAQAVGLDLVMISASKNRSQPPVCKILDSGKYKYEQSKKQKEIARKQRESIVKVKEIKFRPSTDTNDLKTKAKHAEKFLSEGCKIKVSIMFKGREMTHKNIAYDKIFEFINMISNAYVLEDPKMNGRQMTCILAVKKDAREPTEMSQAI